MRSGDKLLNFDLRDENDQQDNYSLTAEQYATTEGFQQQLSLESDEEDGHDGPFSNQFNPTQLFSMTQMNDFITQKGDDSNPFPNQVNLTGDNPNIQIPMLQRDNFATQSSLAPPKTVYKSVVDSTLLHRYQGVKRFFLLGFLGFAFFTSLILILYGKGVFRPSVDQDQPSDEIAADEREADRKEIHTALLWEGIVGVVTTVLAVIGAYVKPSPDNKNYLKFYDDRILTKVKNCADTEQVRNPKNDQEADSVIQGLREKTTYLVTKKYWDALGYFIRSTYDNYITKTQTGMMNRVLRRDLRHQQTMLPSLTPIDMGEEISTTTTTTTATAITSSFSASSPSTSSNNGLPKAVSFNFNGPDNNGKSSRSKRGLGKEQSFFVSTGFDNISKQLTLGEIALLEFITIVGRQISFVGVDGKGSKAAFKKVLQTMLAQDGFKVTSSKINFRGKFFTELFLADPVSNDSYNLDDFDSDTSSQLDVYPGARNAFLELKPLEQIKIISALLQSDDDGKIVAKELILDIPGLSSKQLRNVMNVYLEKINKEVNLFPADKEYQIAWLCRPEFGDTTTAWDRDNKGIAIRKLKQSSSLNNRLKKMLTEDTDFAAKLLLELCGSSSSAQSQNSQFLEDQDPCVARAQQLFWEVIDDPKVRVDILDKMLKLNEASAHAFKLLQKEILPELTVLEGGSDQVVATGRIKKEHIVELNKINIVRMASAIAAHDNGLLVLKPLLRSNDKHMQTIATQTLAMLLLDVSNGAEIQKQLLEVYLGKDPKFKLDYDKIKMLLRPYVPIASDPRPDETSKLLSENERKILLVVMIVALYRSRRPTRIKDIQGLFFHYSEYMNHHHPEKRGVPGGDVTTLSEVLLFDSDQAKRILQNLDPSGAAILMEIMYADFQQVLTDRQNASLAHPFNTNQFLDKYVASFAKWFTGTTSLTTEERKNLFKIVLEFPKHDHCGQLQTNQMFALLFHQSIITLFNVGNVGNVEVTEYVDMKPYAKNAKNFYKMFERGNVSIRVRYKNCYSAARTSTSGLAMLIDVFDGNCSQYQYPAEWANNMDQNSIDVIKTNMVATYIYGCYQKIKQKNRPQYTLYIREALKLIGLDSTQDYVLNNAFVGATQPLKKAFDRLKLTLNNQDVSKIHEMLLKDNANNVKADTNTLTTHLLSAVN